LKVLIIGGGFAGARCAQELSKNKEFEVTLIDRKDYFEISFAQLAALIDPISIGEKSRFLYSKFIKASFLQGEVKTVTEKAVMLSDGSQINYEILVIATGSSYLSFPIGKPSNEIKLKDRNKYFVNENSRLKSSKEVLIIGGGPVGVELAGEIASANREKRISLVHNNERLINVLKPEAGEKALRQLKALGVNVVLNEKVIQDNGNQYRSTISNKIYITDIVYNCVGTSVNTNFMKDHFSISMDEKGLLKVDDKFMVRNTPNIYAIGDCASIDEAKLGTFANSHGEFLAKNLIALSNSETLVPYSLKKTIALVPIGRKKGVAQLSFGVLTNKFIIQIKTKDFFISKYRKLLSIS